MLLTLLIISIIVYIVAKILTDRTIKEIEQLHSSEDDNIEIERWTIDEFNIPEKKQ